MPGKIYLIQNDRSLQELRQEPYPNENEFQTLLEQYPDLLAGDQMDEEEPRRWLLVAREMGVPDEEAAPNQWSLDHLFLDQDGIPTLVEVKRASDTRIRRQVVGQMLDYAANAILYWPVETLQKCLEETCERQGADPAQRLADLLNISADDEAAIAAFWDRVKTNLQASKIRLVFVADRIPPELRRIVEFLGKTMDPVQVFAVEIHQYVGRGLRTLVPQVIGQVRKIGPASRIVWNEETFFRRLAETRGADVVRAARRIYEWALEHLDVTWGRGSSNGAFFVTVKQYGKAWSLLSVWNWLSSGPLSPNAYVEVQGVSLRRCAPFNDPKVWQELCQRLGEFWPRPLADPESVKLPNAPLAYFTDEGRLQALLGFLEWAAMRIQEIV